MSDKPPLDRPVLGFDPHAAAVLRLLVGRDHADETTIADALDLTAAELAVALAVLERDRLVVRSDRTPGRWAALPPRSALGLLLARRRSELASWEQYVEELQDEYSAVSERAGSSRHLEVLTGAEQVSTVYTQLLESSTREVLHLAKPPYIDSSEHPAGSAADDAVLNPGLELRSVYDSSGFTDPVSLHTAFQGRANGGRLRLLDDVPIKLAIFDRRTALLPIHGEDPVAGSLLVHTPALVASLVALFDNLWERAVPLELVVTLAHGGPTARPVAADVSSPARARDILGLMAAGLTDDAIARALGISRRTVQKHISELAEALGARTRFQIALLASERGLVGPRARLGDATV